MLIRGVCYNTSTNKEVDNLLRMIISSTIHYNILIIITLLFGEFLHYGVQRST